MKKALLFVLSLAALSLAACTPKAAPAAATAVPTASAVPAAGAGTAQPAPIATSSGPAACKAGVDPLPLPEVTDDEWQQGPKDAKITILEYSDYQ